MAPDAGPGTKEMSAAEIGAMAHLYRGEVYRSTLWRTRLDTTTNWSVVTLGIALSIAYSSPAASPLPLLLVGILIFFFLMLEARRYRYFNVWRARCRWIETHFYAPMLDPDGCSPGKGWRKVLADDLLRPRYHVSLWVSIGRRVRRNYFWILLIQTCAYMGKLLVHPEPLTSAADLVVRADVGPVPGTLVLGFGVLYCGTLGVAAWMSWRQDRKRMRQRNGWTSMG